MRSRQGISGLLILLAVVWLVAGCGGGSSSDADADAQRSESDGIEASEPGEGEPSRSFLSKGDQNKIPKFGREASAKERAAASKVLEENLRAREAGNWSAQCASLTPEAIIEVKEGAVAQGVGGGGCAKELKARAEPLQRSKPLRVNTLTGPIDALRFKGRRAYALYHGPGGQDYAMPMEKIKGTWKVNSLLEESL
jgi:hypothetical protein